MDDPHLDVTRPPQQPGDLPAQGNGIAAAALIMGILGYPLFCAQPLIGLTCGVLAIVFGMMGRSRSRMGVGGGGMATAGLVLGAVMIGGGILLVAGCLAMFGVGAGILNEAAQSGVTGLE